jgi:hypothetical protein
MAEFVLVGLLCLQKIIMRTTVNHFPTCFNHRKYIRIDITTLGQGHGRVCLADGNSHISPSVIFFCQGKFTTSIP